MQAVPMETSRRRSTLWKWAMGQLGVSSDRVHEQLSLLHKSPGSLTWDLYDYVYLPDIMQKSNSYLIDMQIFMLLQSSICCTTPRSTCSEVKSAKKSLFDNNKKMQPPQCCCRTSLRCHTRRNRKRGSWLPDSRLLHMSWPMVEARSEWKCPFKH